MSKIISIHTKEQNYVPNRDSIDIGKLMNYASEMKQILFMIEQSLEKTSSHDTKDLNC